MRISIYGSTVLTCAMTLACSGGGQPSGSSAAAAARGIDSLNARLIAAYREHDPVKYGALYTDSAVFEWPAISALRGREAMEKLAHGSWASLKNMDLRLTVASRSISSDRATEFGAFEQSWDDDRGVRRTEFGRYVTAMVRQGSGEWLIDRFLGFADSTR